MWREKIYKYENCVVCECSFFAYTAESYPTEKRRRGGYLIEESKSKRERGGLLKPLSTRKKRGGGGNTRPPWGENKN